MSESVLAHPTSLPALPLQAVGAETFEFTAASAWIRAARLCNFNIEPLFQAVGVDMSRQGQIHITKPALVSLMQACVGQAAPQHHFPLVLGDSFAFDYLPALDTFLATTPTLRQALPALQWASMSMPNVDLAVQEQGPESALLINVALPTDNARVHGYFVESVLSGVNKFVRMALGDLSDVSHVELRHDPGPQKLACERLWQMSIRANQARDAVVFDRRLLDKPLPGGVPSLHRKVFELIEQQLPAKAADKLSDQLERAFRQSPSLLGQGIERMARRMDLHPRTLQRRLREEGQLFADIQARCRFEMAAISLKTTTCDIETLSDKLGFSDRHSFTRAFKRWTGLAPSEFRDQHAHQKAETKS